MSKEKVYADIKLNGKTATNDDERSSMFAKHMESTCQTLHGSHYDEKHKINCLIIISNVTI